MTWGHFFDEMYFVSQGEGNWNFFLLKGQKPDENIFLLFIILLRLHQFEGRSWFGLILIWNAVEVDCEVVAVGLFYEALKSICMSQRFLADNHASEEKFYQIYYDSLLFCEYLYVLTQPCKLRCLKLMMVWKKRHHLLDVDIKSLTMHALGISDVILHHT